MIFDPPLISGQLIRRYKRFLSDIELESGEVVTAHVANPGAMLGLKDPGSKVLLSRSNNPKRKLQFSWEMIQIQKHWVGVNTLRPNQLAEEAITNGKIPELQGFSSMRREVAYGKNSRIDILLEDGHKSSFIEIKNSHLMRKKGVAEFPDSVTKRGLKHLDELATLSAKGVRAVVLIVVQREDCSTFTIAKDIDPAFGQAWERARRSGVETLCYDCSLSRTEIVINNSMQIIDTETQ